MNNFKLIHTYTWLDKKDKTKTTHEFSQDSLPDILEEVTAFLQGCGFSLDGLEVYHEGDDQ